MKGTECLIEREKDETREGNMKWRDWREKPDMTDGTGKERDESREGKAEEGTTEEDPQHRIFDFVILLVFYVVLKAIQGFGVTEAEKRYIFP